MTDMPERVCLDPDFDGWDDQVIGWDADRTDDQGRPYAFDDWPVYVREDAVQRIVDDALERAAKSCEEEADKCTKAAAEWNGLIEYAIWCKTSAYAMRNRASAIRALKGGEAMVTKKEER